MTAIRGDRPSGNRGGPKGICPVCRTLQRLLVTNGKVCRHGRTAANPDGCAGSYQPPERKDISGKPITSGGTVVGWRHGDAYPTAHDDQPQPAEERTS